jgi:acetyl-CoA synthetase
MATMSAAGKPISPRTKIYTLPAMAPCAMKQGNYRITGRVDDVLNVSGHRIGTAEVENAINMHSGVVESAVVGYPHDIKGQGIYAYVIYQGHHHIDESSTRQDIIQTVSRIIGPIAKPDKIQFVPGLPKTRSGKIMRRILRKIAEGERKLWRHHNAARPGGGGADC